MKTCNRKEFEEIMANRINVRSCPFCIGGSCSIKIDFPLYGYQGIYAECNRCHHITKKTPIHEFLTTDTSVGFPVTDESLIRSIRSVVKEWNNDIERSNDE